MEAPTRIGRYHVLAPIARGGMAEVFRVKTVGLAGFEKVQALKRIARAQAREPRFIRSFIDEARIAAELSHKNVVQVFDFGEVDGDLYLTMELVDGLDLKTALDRARASGRTLPSTLACHVIAEVAAGLDYAHRRTDAAGHPLGIVHCDVSPANVMLSSEGHVKILDFGIARASFAHAVERRRLRGKPRYMAPEQTRGERPTTATDVFALATVAWELLTGRLLFDGADVAATLAAVRGQPIPPIDRVCPEVPMAVARALDRALDREPARRASALEVARAATLGAAGATARTLAAWLDDVIAHAGPPAPPQFAAATADTLAREPVPEPTSAAVTAPMRPGAAAIPTWTPGTSSDTTTRPFGDDAEPTSTDGPGYAWLDEETELGGPAIGTLDVADLLDAADGADLADATIDQPLDLATHPPPTTRSPS
ncbi:MAG: serine/threonine protein kinase [Myxococcales bacterium]|nr:serine/threonine protein kinase [Myxococcales bacterium]